MPATIRNAGSQLKLGRENGAPSLRRINIMEIEQAKV